MSIFAGRGRRSRRGSWRERSDGSLPHVGPGEAGEGGAARFILAVAEEDIGAFLKLAAIVARKDEQGVLGVAEVVALDGGPADVKNGVKAADGPAFFGGEFKDDGSGAGIAIAGGLCVGVSLGTAGGQPGSLDGTGDQYCRDGKEDPRG